MQYSHCSHWSECPNSVPWAGAEPHLPENSQRRWYPICCESEMRAPRHHRTGNGAWRIHAACDLPSSMCLGSDKVTYRCSVGLQVDFQVICMLTFRGPATRWQNTQYLCYTRQRKLEFVMSHSSGLIQHIGSTLPSTNRLPTKRVSMAVIMKVKSILSTGSNDW